MLTPTTPAASPTLSKSRSTGRLSKTSEPWAYWSVYRPSDFLFPGKKPDRPYADTSIQKAIKQPAAKAGIKKRVHPHALRHSYATGLLEAGVDLLTISRLLGHASFTTTMGYLHCRRENLGSVPSPLDWLPVRQLPVIESGARLSTIYCSLRPGRRSSR